MVININNILFTVAHANSPANDNPTTDPGTNLLDKTVMEKPSTESQFATIQQQVKDLQTEMGNKTSFFGINNSNILVGSIIFEVLLFVVLIILKKGLGRLSKRLAKQNEKIENLTRKIEQLEHNAAQQKMSAPVTNWPAPPKPVVETQIFSAPRPIERMPEPRPITAEDKYKDFVKDFNALVGQSGINLKNARSDFMRKYNVQTFTCTNFEARMNEPVPAPVFDSANSVANPDYWAYEFESGVFAVVPNVKIYSDNHHTARAMGEVFTSNFTAGRTYNKIHVNKPAIFKGMWNFEKQGELELS